MKNFIFLLTLLLCSNVTFAQVKVSEFVEVAVPNGDFEVPDIVTKKRTKLKFSGVRIVTTPLATAPTATGNTSNLNRIVTTVGGDAYFVDWFGNATRMGSAGVTPISLISNDLDNKLHLGSDNKLFVDGVDINSLISSNANNDLGVGSDNKLFVPTATIPTLQQVTGVGNVTTVPLLVDNTLGAKQVDIIKDGVSYGVSLKANTLTTPQVVQFSDNSGTVALLSDIPSPQPVPTLEQVLGAGNTANTDLNIGPLNAINVGGNIEIGNNLFVQGTINSVQSVHAPEVQIGDFNTISANLKSTNITASREIQMPNNSGTIALTNDLPCFASNVTLNASNCYEAIPNFVNDTHFYNSYPLTFDNITNVGAAGNKGVGLRLSRNDNYDSENSIWKTWLNANNTQDYAKMTYSLVDQIGNHKSFLLERGITNGGSLLRGSKIGVGVGNVDGLIQLQTTANGTNWAGISIYPSDMYATNIANGVGSNVLYINPVNGRITQSAAPTSAGDNWGSQVISTTSSTILGNGTVASPISVNTTATGLPSNSSFLVNMKERFSISDNVDVNNTPPTNGQILIYSTVMGQYVPSTLASPIKAYVQVQKGAQQIISAAQTVNLSSWTDALSGGSSSSFDLVGGVFTAPRGGYYKFSANVKLGSFTGIFNEAVILTFTTPQNPFKSFTNAHFFQGGEAIPVSLHTEALMYLAVGQQVTLKLTNGTTSTITCGELDTNFLSIQEL